MGYRYDPSRVEQAIDGALAARRVTATHRWYRSGDRIVVVLEASVDYIFAKAVPGGPPRTTVHAARRRPPAGLPASRELSGSILTH